MGLQISMLWVMHLRTLCSLRGVKPSEVLGSGVQQWLKEFRANHAFSQRDDIVVQYIQQAPADIKVHFPVYLHLCDSLIYLFILNKS